MEAESAIWLGAIALIVILKNTNALVKPLNELKHFHGAESVILQGAVFTYCHNAKCHGSCLTSQ